MTVYRPTKPAENPHRQRHDIPWSQPLPPYPPTLAEEPLPEPRCSFREWTAADEAIEDNPSDNGTGPRCPHTALWLSCRPYVNSPTCVEHKCRCAKPIAPPASSPVPMVLHCPECRVRHIDEGEFATKPHHTHSCQGCGLTWRPAVVATVGVRFLPGFKNEEPEPPASEPSDAIATVREVVAALRTKLCDLGRFDMPARQITKLRNYELIRELKIARAAHAAEVERLRGELAEAKRHCAEYKGWLDDVAGALHGWPPDSRKTYVPTQLAAWVVRMREARKAAETELAVRARPVSDTSQLEIDNIAELIFKLFGSHRIDYALDRGVTWDYENTAVRPYYHVYALFGPLDGAMPAWSITAPETPENDAGVRLIVAVLNRIAGRFGRLDVGHDRISNDDRR